MGFRQLRNVRGDGNCYYRAVMCGYFETLLSGEDVLIKDFIKMLRSDRKYFDLGINNKEVKEKAIAIIERLAKVKKQLGIQKALQEYFLESISNDVLNYVSSQLKQ